MFCAPVIAISNAALLLKRGESIDRGGRADIFRCRDGVVIARRRAGSELGQADLGARANAIACSDKLCFIVRVPLRQDLDLE